MSTRCSLRADPMCDSRPACLSLRSLVQTYCPVLCLLYGAQHQPHNSLSGLSPHLPLPSSPRPPIPAATHPVNSPPSISLLPVPSSPSPQSKLLNPLNVTLRQWISLSLVSALLVFVFHSYLFETANQVLFFHSLLLGEYSSNS